MEALLALFCFFVALAVILVVVAAVGHGIWLMATAIFGSAKPRDDHSRPTGRQLYRRCVGCGEEFYRDADECPACGLDRHGKVATELKDLEAAARTIQKLRDDNLVSTDAAEQIHKSIEERRRVLLPRRHVTHIEEHAPPTDSVQQLEALFGHDAGKSLSVAARQHALAILRTLPTERLPKLSAAALVGVARLQRSVGLLTRASEAYRTLFKYHADAPIAASAAAEAIETACNLGDWDAAQDFADFAVNVPGLLAREPELTALIERVRARGAAPAVPVVVPAPVVQAQVVETLAAATITSTPIAPEQIEPAPRRSFAEWIAVFMEERNILWGELIGGTLIVGCSIALVISLWATIEEIEYFPFLLLAIITGGLFGAGFYTLHHWKLESTSRGLLLIATLLSPLNFLVLAGLARTEDARIWDYALGIGSLALFSWLLYRSSRILIQTPLDVPMPSALATALAMFVSAAAQLLAPPLLTQDTWQAPFLSALSLAPALAHVAALGWILVQMHGVESWSVPRLAALLIALGSVTFACGTTLGFLIAHELHNTLLPLAPAVTLVGVPILIAGILIFQRFAPQGENAEASRGLWRTLGTGLGLLGILVMFGGFAVSIQSPALRWICGGLNLATLLAAAWVLRVPALHVPAQVYLASLAIIGWTFDVDAMIHSPNLSLKLIGLLAAQTLLAEILTRRQRRVDARYYALGGAVSTVLALALILPHVGRDPGLAAVVFGSAAFIWCAADLRWRHAEITYACSLALAAALFFATRHFFAISLVEQILWSLLAHAAICLGTSIALRYTAPEWVRDVLRIPLQLVSLGGTFAIAATIMIGQVLTPQLGWIESSLACAGLAALWLTIAALETWPILFAVFQGALGLVWIFGIGGWLASQGWDWREPYALQVYALGLGMLGLFWELTRAFSPRQDSNLADAAPDFRSRLAALLTPDFVPIDRIVTSGLIAVQYLFTACAVVWAVGREVGIDPELWRMFPAGWHENAFSVWAWLLLLPLAGALVVHLRQRDLAMPLLGVTILGLTLPLLAAGTWFDAQVAAASAVRWGLVLAYAIVSLLMWNRQRLGAELAARVPAVAIRVLLIAGAVVPLLWITLIVAVAKFTQRPLGGPIGGLFFEMWAPASLLAPLGILIAVLAGHGFRERLAYYLSAAGVLMPITGVGTYFLGLQMADVPLDQPWVPAGALLLGSGLAWVWSILWAQVASMLETGDDRPLLESALLSLQGALGDFLYGAVLLTAVAWIIGGDSEGGRIWTQAVGSPWGWLAFAVLAFGSGFYSLRKHGAVPLHLLGVLGLATVAMTACTFEVFQRDQSLIALMFGSALFACLWVWSHLFLDSKQPPRWLTCDEHLRESVIYALIGVGLAVWIACGTFVNAMRDPIWSANAILLAAAACVLLAYQRKAEVWTALASALAIPAATIFVLHFCAGEPNVWLSVIHIDLAVLGAASLLRIGLHHFVAIEMEEVRHLRFLPVQITLGIVGTAALLALALTTVVIDPARPGRWLMLHGYWPSWLALAANAAAAVWYVGLARPRWVVHAVAIHGLMLGIVLAGTFEWSEWPPWLAHHVLTLAWTILGVAVMIASWLGHVEGRARWADTLREFFPERWARGWVTLCGALVVALALRAAWIEPGAPYWNIGNTFAVSVLLGMLAIWARAPIYVYASGLLFNVIGLLIYSAWLSHRVDAAGVPALEEWLSNFVLAQVLSFAAAAIVWSLVEARLLARGIDLSQGFPFSQAALMAGILVLAVGVGLANGLHLLGDDVRVGTTLAWISLGVLAAAAVCEIWRVDFHRFTRYQLYTCGLLAIGLVLFGVERDDWLRHAALLLAGYVLLIVICTRLVHASDAVREMLRLPATPDGKSNWFWQVQIVTIALVAALSVWLSLTEATLEHRFAAASACAIATIAAFVLVGVWPRIYADDGTGLSQHSFPCWLVLTLGLALALDVSWASIPLDLPALWLQRTAATLAVLGAATFLYRFVLSRWLDSTIWSHPSQALAAILGVVSVTVLIVLLGQELIAYNPAEGVRSTPMLKVIAALSGLAIASLAGLSVWSALTRQADIYGIEADRRGLYVYLAELLIVSLLAHVRLNLPDVLHPVVGQYWYLVVMVVALAGLALSEFFARKEIPILAVPIKRSVVALAFLPVLAFRLGFLAGYCEPLKQIAPGLDPFLKYLRDLSKTRIFSSDILPMESLCWLLLGIFLGSLAQLRKSANYGILAALAVNFGVWVLLGHQDATQFLQRPQLWLIPLGLIVLVAEFVNRDQLGFWPSMSVRYAGLLCIYLSSTIEMFKDGISENPWLPVVLALLAVGGVLLGILFRVRAFLLSGFLALLVVVFAMIWQAAVVHERMWVWWACGIGLGVVILVMFAVFEKHRNEVIKVIDSMKRWN